MSNYLIKDCDSMGFARNFKCLKCKRNFSTNQSLLTHTHAMHN